MVWKGFTGGTLEMALLPDMRDAAASLSARGMLVKGARSSISGNADEDDDDANGSVFANGSSSPPNAKEFSV